MTPNEAEQALYQDLLSIYARAGAEVTYETDKGDVRPYWAKRFLQAVKRSERSGELFAFVARLLGPPEPSRGFLILKKAERLDLTVEALVINPSKSYYAAIDPELVEIARQRLVEHGYEPPASGSAGSEPKAPSTERAAVHLASGASFDLRVTVGSDGKLAIALI